MRNIQLKGLLFIGVIFFLWSCTPKAVVPLTENKPEEEEPVVEKPNRITPCITFDDIPNGDDIMSAFVLYRDQLKLKNYNEAYKLWKIAMYNAPGSNGRVQYHYDDGVTIFTHFFEKAQTEAEKKQWVDSISWLYEKRMDCFGDIAYLSGRKAFDCYYYYKSYVPEDSIYTWFKRAIDGKKEKTDYFVVNPFVKMLWDKYSDGSITQEEASRYANELLAILDYGPKNCKDTECQAWEIINEYAPKLLANFEGIPDFYDCNYYVIKYYKLYKENPEDCETVNLSYRKMRSGKCPEDLAELKELQEIMSTRCYVAPPDPGPLRRAFDAYNAGKFREAINHFKEFTSTTTDKEQKAKYTLVIAKIYYAELVNYPEARKFALAAAGIKSGWGEPFMLIGKLYASSGPLCGPGRGWDSQIVTWAAVDKFLYARSIDPSVASEANKLIAEYSRYMPSKEEIFSRMYREGDKFRVPCWIQEDTVIRAAPK